MTWLGKVVGGTIGFALGGPIGAIAGAAFGHMFDGNEGQQALPAANASPMSKEETSQMVFFTACFSMLGKLVKADGSLTEQEMASIRQFSDPALQKLRSRYAPQSDKYYQILGCSRTDSDDTLKTRYRKLVLDFHPDTIAGKGLPDEFVTFAHDKFREIQEAYEMVKKERGMA